jgi:protein-tyrosine phosphatase
VRSRPGYRCIPLLDAAAPTPQALADHVRGISVPRHGRLMIHCANGHGRSALVAAAWLIAHRFASSPTDALEQLRAARPRIRLRPPQRQSLELASHILATSDTSTTNPDTLAVT